MMPQKMLERSDDGVRFTIMLGFGHRLGRPVFVFPSCITVISAAGGSPGECVCDVLLSRVCTAATDAPVPVTTYACTSERVYLNRPVQLH